MYRVSVITDGESGKVPSYSVLVTWESPDKNRSCEMNYQLRWTKTVVFAEREDSITLRNKYSAVVEVMFDCHRTC